MKRLIALQYGLLFCLTVAATLCVMSLVRIDASTTRLKPTQPAGQNAQPTAQITEPPKISSRVKKVLITDIRITGVDTANPTLEVTIANHTNKPVIAVELRSGDISFRRSGDILGPDELAAVPEPVIAPHDTTVMPIALGNFRQGEELIVSAVIFADGTYSGEVDQIKAMRAEREAIRERQKEVKPQ